MTSNLIHKLPYKTANDLNVNIFRINSKISKIVSQLIIVDLSKCIRDKRDI